MSTALDGSQLQSQIERLSNQTGIPQGSHSHGTDFPEDLGPEEIASMGVMKAQEYMMRNETGVPKNAPKVMSKAQLEEQKMNEAAGYPSNLDEAAKVKALEGDVAQIKGMMTQMINMMQGQGTVSPTAPPTKHVQSQPTPSFPASPTPQPNDSENSSEDQTIKFPSVGQAPGRPIEVEEVEGEDVSWEESVEEDTQVAEEAQQAERVARMVTSVASFLKSNDPLKFFKSVLKRATDSRFTLYDSWSPRTKQDFLREFKNILSDSTFLTLQVEKILNFEQGHAVSDKRAAELIVLMAGGTAFVMAGA